MKRKWILPAICGLTICALPMYAGSAANTHSDQEFLNIAAQADMTTVHLGKLAQEKSSAEGIKDFGKKLVQDHTHDYALLSELANKTGESIPKGIDAQNDREISHLDRYKGKTFDRQFLAAETAAHEKLIKAFKEEAEHGNNPDIKAYASKTLPVIEGHLHQAEDLLKPGKHTA